MSISLIQAHHMLTQWASWHHAEFNRLGAAAPRFYREVAGGDWQDKEPPPPDFEDRLIERVDSVVTRMTRDGNAAATAIKNYYLLHDRRYSWSMRDWMCRVFVAEFDGG